MSELPVSETFLIGCVGALAGLCGAFFTCILRSRCSRIKFCGVECERVVTDTPQPPIEVRAVNVNR